MGLWIDFKLYFYVSNHKQTKGWNKRQVSCELISNCIFTWAITRVMASVSNQLLLWIDFKLYFYVSNHKVQEMVICTLQVVNWFQIVFLREQSQEVLMIVLIYLCCELISNCIFTWAITRQRERSANFF